MKISTLTLSIAATLVAGSACAQSALSGYTIKLGAGRVDPRATSSDLVGTLPVPSGAGRLMINLPEGNRTEVQPKSTLIFSIERALSNNWSVELVAGTPPTHDVKLLVSDTVKAGAAAAAPIQAAFGKDAFTNPALRADVLAALAANPKIGAAGAAGAYGSMATGSHVNLYNNVTVARVKQTAPTVFLNYKFFEQSAALRPYVGVGLNYTKFKVTSTAAGNELYSDGKVRISSSDSFGLAFQVGGTYQIDKNWSLNAGWATAAVRNDVVIRTDHTEERLFYRFHPSVFSATVGYSF
ncbi:OmpW/AlkL family protein [Aquabacterium sp.]|uniref:OmpW/AlkL family protein n=1 Tax=Aquabacterium sp. TaxID=1872578 RepID=UPI003B6C0744